MHFRAVRQHFGPLNLELSDPLTDPPLEDGKRNGRQIFFLD